ncbi:MAG: metal-binding protein [Chloroflexi bacterium]|nr:metal-binding protein [Chloroflexota bacterium]
MGRWTAHRRRNVVEPSAKTYTLIGRDGKRYESQTQGALGGHRSTRIYGRLDCPSALRWIAKGHYVRHRVFFADEETAIAAGYRPCAVCMSEEYAAWKVEREERKCVPERWGP